MLLYIESKGFDPASPGPNPAAANPVGGLNQMSLENLSTLGVSRPTWLSLSAAQQLPIIFRFWQSLARSFAGGAFPPDGPRLLALNFLPASYQASGAATSSTAVLSGKNGPYAADYAPNAWYDPDGTGEITPQTIAKRFALEDAANAPRWQTLRVGIAAAVDRQTPGGRATARRGAMSVALPLLLAGLAAAGYAHTKGWV